MAQLFFRAITLIAAFALPASALAYDSTWHRMSQWSGEYPTGFTMTETRTLSLRERPDTRAPGTIPCRFEKNATYHPWNQTRVREQNLQFVSFTKIREFVVQTAFRDDLFNRSKSRTSRVRFKRGDRWRYLASLAEGQIVFEYGGSEYEGGQTLFEYSAPVSRHAEVPATGYDEWMRVSCPGGSQGWLFMRDLADLSGFGAPNVIRYGEAGDAAEQAR